MELYEFESVIRERVLGTDREVRDVDSLDWIELTGSYPHIRNEVAAVPHDWSLRALARRGYVARFCMLKGKYYITRKSRDWDKWADENCPEHLR